MKDEELWYMALDTFKGTEDMFWRQELYTIEEFELNGGFTFEELLNTGKIKPLSDPK